MTEQAPDMVTVVARLEKVERENLRLKKAGYLLFILTTGIMALGASSHSTEKLSLQQFVLSACVVAIVLIYFGILRRVPAGKLELIKDPKGKLRAELIADPEGSYPEVTALRVLDRNGEHRVGIGVFDDEGSVSVVGKDQVTNVSLRIQEGRPRLIFWKGANGTGTQRIDLGQMKDGSHALVLMDEHSTPRIKLGVKENGSPFLALLTDKAVRACLTVDSEGSPFLNIFNMDSKVIWHAP